MPSFLRLLGATIPLCLSLQAAPPNIVFILVDDLGWSDLGCYGADLHADLAEARNLAATEPERTAQLHARLKAQLASAKAQLPVPNPKANSAPREK